MIVQRSLRISELLKQDINNIIRKDVKDPDIGMLNITRIIVSPDLKTAKIYLSVIGEQTKREKTFQALKRANGYIRTALGHRGSYRNVPELHFFYDDTLDYVFTIEALIQKAKEKDNSDEV